MELRHFRYFLAAAEELNISKASRRLNVSQPAISRLIRDLEDEVGTHLFVRERFGLALTPSGEKLLGYARRIVDLSVEAVHCLRDQPVTATMITIGFMASSLGSFFGAALKSFREAYPDITVRIHELSPADQVTALRKGQIDIAFIGNPCGPVHDEFETRILFEMELQAVVPANHPLARQRVISLKELALDDFIGYREESFPGRNQTILAACLLGGFTPLLRHQAGSLVEVLALIGAGAGVCLMPADVANLPHPGVAFIAISDPVAPIRFTAAWRSSDDQTIINCLLDHAQHERELSGPVSTS